MSSKDNDEERVMHLKSDNIEIIINDKADEVLEELFQSLLSTIIHKIFDTNSSTKYGKDLISIFQQSFASINKIFILG